jgi:hypothetical protein
MGLAASIGLAGPDSAGSGGSTLVASAAVASPDVPEDAPLRGFADASVQMLLGLDLLLSDKQFWSASHTFSAEGDWRGIDVLPKAGACEPFISRPHVLSWIGLGARVTDAAGQLPYLPVMKDVGAVSSTLVEAIGVSEAQTPEPATAIAMAAGVSMLVCRRRRR